MNLSVNNKYFKNIKLAILVDVNSNITYQYLGSNTCTGIDNLLKYGVKFEPVLKNTSTIMSKAWPNDLKLTFKPEYSEQYNTISTLNELAIPTDSDDSDEDTDIDYFANISIDNTKLATIINLPKGISNLYLFDDYTNDIDSNVISVIFNSTESVSNLILLIETSISDLGNLINISQYIFDSLTDPYRNLDKYILNNDYLNSILNNYNNNLVYSGDLVFDPISKVLLGTRKKIDLNSESLPILNKKINKYSKLWSSTTMYNTGDQVLVNLYDDTVWESLIDGNIGEYPESSPCWKLKDYQIVNQYNKYIYLINKGDLGDVYINATNLNYGLINDTNNLILDIIINLPENTVFCGFFTDSKCTTKLSNYIFDSDNNLYKLTIDFNELKVDSNKYNIYYKFDLIDLEKDEITNINLTINGIDLEDYINNDLLIIAIDSSNIEYKLILNSYTINSDENILVANINLKYPNKLENSNYYLITDDNYLYDTSKELKYQLIDTNKILLQFDNTNLIYYIDNIIISKLKPTITIDSDISDDIELNYYSILFDNNYYCLKIQYSHVKELENSVIVEITPGLQENSLQDSDISIEKVISSFTNEDLVICTETYRGLIPGINYTIKLK